MVFECEGARLINAKCEDVLPTLADNSINAIVTDPPYFKVKDEEWDNQWKSKTEFLAWLESLSVQFERILKPNGSLYLFASPRMAASVEVMLAKRFNIIQRITWSKPMFSTKAEMFRKEDLRMFFPSSEAIIFAEHYGADNFAKGEAGYESKCDDLRGFVFEPLRAYLVSEWKRAGLKPDHANIACGTASMAARHFFSVSQWCLPTEKHYLALRSYANSHNHGGECLRREYEDLRREYEDLRRTFSVSADVPYTDVWQFSTVGFFPGKHQCEKPLDLMEHIIKTSTKKGDTVIDCFMGRCSTGVACLNLGRNFIGIEKDEKWFDKSKQRIEQNKAQLKLDLAV